MNREMMRLATTFCLALGVIFTALSVHYQRDRIAGLESRLRVTETNVAGFDMVISRAEATLGRIESARWIATNAVRAPYLANQIVLTNSSPGLYSTNLWSDEFAAGVRYGMIAKGLHPEEDNISELTKIAQRLRSQVQSAITNTP